MELFVGLDVSVRTTSVCVMDAGGKGIQRGKSRPSRRRSASCFIRSVVPISALGLKRAGFPMALQWAGRAGFPVSASRRDT